jgi:hypothetical protein
MPDYELPYFQVHPGEDYARNIAQARQRHDQEGQTKFENARQTAQDKIAAAEAARKLTAMQGYSDDVSALQKQYPQGGPEFNNGLVIASMKRFGDSPGAMSAGARSLFTPPDSVPAGSPWAPGTSPTPISAPPSASGQPAPVSPGIAPPGMATPPAVPPMQPATAVPNAPVVRPPPAPIPTPTGPAVAAPTGATQPPTIPQMIPISPRAQTLAEKKRMDDATLDMRKQQLAQTGQSQTNNLNLRKDALANTETNQAATRQFHEDTLANTEANQKIQQTQRRLNLAFRNKALAATVQGRQLTAYLRMAQDDPKNAADLTKRANELMDEMGVDKDGEAKTPEATAAPVTATNPKTGEKVQLIDGKWQPVQQ